MQSGNAVDGIDVGIFDFEPLVRSKVRTLSDSILFVMYTAKICSLVSNVANTLVTDGPEGAR